jgi:predicted ArsR family transcriptional regulator
MITREAWLSALEASIPKVVNDPGLMTREELAEFLGVSWSTAKRHGERLVKAGKAERATKTIVVPGNGRRMIVTPYRLKQ